MENQRDVYIAHYCFFESYWHTNAMLYYKRDVILQTRCYVTNVMLYYKRYISSCLYFFIMSKKYL